MRDKRLVIELCLYLICCVEGLDEETETVLAEVQKEEDELTDETDINQ